MMTNNLYTVNHHFVTYSLLKSCFWEKRLRGSFLLEIPRLLNNPVTPKTLLFGRSSHPIHGLDTVDFLSTQ